jgi:hypothetical protein
LLYVRYTTECPNCPRPVGFGPLGDLVEQKARDVKASPMPLSCPRRFLVKLLRLTVRDTKSNIHKRRKDNELCSFLA